MKNWTSVTDILDRLQRFGVPADEAIAMAAALIAMGKAAQAHATDGARKRECRGCEADAASVHHDWVAILGRGQ
jgi:hypothetical protein